MQLLVVVRLTSSFRAFEMFILATIFANCVALAANTPFPGNDSNDVNAVLVSFHLLFFVYRRRFMCRCAINNLDIRISTALAAKT